MSVHGDHDHDDARDGDHGDHDDHASGYVNDRHHCDPHEHACLRRRHQYFDGLLFSPFLASSIPIRTYKRIMT
ncbi:hypothetical protein D3C73_1627720 [compost metagenome]